MAEVQKRLSLRLSIHTVLPVFQTLCRKAIWIRSSQHGIADEKGRQMKKEELVAFLNE